MMDFSTSQRSARVPKRVRSAFTTQQIEFLEQQFKKSPYISSECRKQLAFVLKIQERAVKIWFQNRRMREKKDLIKKDCEGYKNDESRRQLNNVCAMPSANDLSSFQVITKPVVVASANSDDTVYFKPKAKTNTVLSHYFEPSVDVDVKPASNKPKAKTAVLSHFVKPPVSLNDNLSVSAKTNAKSPTALSNFFEQYKHRSRPSLRNPTVTNTTNKNAVSIPKKHCSLLTDCKTHINTSTGNYNLNMKVVQDLQRKNLCSKVKSRSNSSELKTRKLSKSSIKTMKTANVRKPAFLPVMQTMYSPIPPASIVWKPVNILPAPGTPVNTYGIPQTPQSQQKKCSCNCIQSYSSSPVYGPGVNINNSPYYQYILPLSFQNHGPNF